MNKYVFSAVFEPNPGGGYSTSFPDLPGCIGYGATLDNALKSAQESLELHLYGMEEDHEPIPEATPPERIQLDDGEFSSCITARMSLIRSEMRERAVKKTLTIPAWLNDIAEKEHLNFSQILQSALKDHLGVVNR